VEDWKGHIGQKNSALERCTSDWILSVDCDEVVSPELRESILQALSRKELTNCRVNRKTFFLDTWIEHAWYPDWKVRLVRRGVGRWGGVDPHDRLTAAGPSLDLSGDLHHYSFRDLRDFVERQVRYAVIGAQAYHRAGRRSSLAKILFNPLHGFFKHYLLKRGFLDGLPGLIISVVNGFYIFMKYALLWEIQRNRQRGNK
jgi:glycosyltransferase involved in cell wall biosynthesis